MRRATSWHPCPSGIRRLSVVVLACIGVAGAASAQDAAGDESLLLHDVRQLTFDGRRAGEGYFGPDGRTMIFQSERAPGNPFYQIYLLDLGSGAVRQVSPGRGKTTCGWIHPDGGRVLFASTHLDPEAQAKQEAELEQRARGPGRRYEWSFDPQYELFERDLGSGALRSLAPAPGYDAEGSWSPDGRLIAFASNRHAYEGSLTPEERAERDRDPSRAMDIYLMNADGSGLRRLTDTPGYDGGPFFSPDGTKIVWRRFAADGATAEVFTMNVDGTGERRITQLGALSWAPFFHPSGDYIIFSTSLTGPRNFELYLVDSAGARPPVRVTASEGFDGLPAFSPDGNTLAWSSTRGGGEGAQIFLARWDDAAARRALGLPARDGAMAGGGPPPAAAGQEHSRSAVARLTAGDMAGRLTGTPGAEAAAAHIAEAFAALGLEPAGDDGYFQTFPFAAGARLGDGNRLTAAGRQLVLDRDWRPLAFSAVGNAPSAPVAFAGYGILAPATDGQPAYDSYGDLDVAGKWVMVLRYLPEGIGPEARRRLSAYADLAYKAAVARRKGAAGLIVVSGPRTAVRSQLVALDADIGGTSSGLPAVSMADAAAARLLEEAGRSLDRLQEALDRGEGPIAFELPAAITLSAELDLVHETRHGRNVLARLPGRGGDAGPAVVIGAHYDHLGHGISSRSLARGDEAGQIHPGADDNASGVAALVEVAARLTEARRQGALPPGRDILLAAWSGEELGLLGSGHFAQQRAGATMAYVNMDMVGRLRDRLIIQGVGSAPEWPGRIEAAAAPLGLPLLLQDDPYVSTDSLSFYMRGVPVLNLFTGSHDDYHTPRDTADKVNHAGIAAVSRLVGRLAEGLADPAARLTYREQPRQAPSPRRGRRVYVGTIPDFGATGAGGLRITGTAAGSPAEAAGLQPGDVIVEVAGAAVSDIYGYAQALDGLAPGEPVRLVVIRAAQRLPLTVTPTARE
jgi:Tol biopolymer transport system component